MTILQDAREHLEPGVNHPDCMANLSKTSPFSFHYAPSIWDWSTKNYTIVNNAVPRKSEDEQEKEEASRAIKIGGAISLIASFVLGLAFSRFQTCLNKMNRSAMIIKDHSTVLENFSEFKQLVTKRHEIDQTNYFNTRNQLFSGATILVGGVSLVIGGLKVSTVIMNLGYFLAFAGVCGFLLNLGLHWDDKTENQRRYFEITGFTPHLSLSPVIGLADKVLQKLNGIEKPNDQQEYQSVYPYLPSRNMPSPSAPPADV